MQTLMTKLSQLRRLDRWHVLTCFYLLCLHVLCVFRVINSPDIVAAITLGSVIGLMVWNSKRLGEIEEMNENLTVARKETIDVFEELNTLKDIQSTHVSKLDRLRKMLTETEMGPEHETMAVLGRDLPLGSWYDLSTGRVGALATDKNTILDASVRETRTDVCHCSMLAERLQVSDTLLEYVKSNPKNIKGADRALLRESEKERFAIIVMNITEEIRCQNALLRDEVGIHTHRVVSVLYGLRVIISLQARSSNLDEHTLKKLAVYIASTDGSRPDFELFGNEVDCFVDSDLPLCVEGSDKITPLKARELYSSLPKIFPAVESIPIYVKLEKKHPLQDFCDTYVALEEAEVRCRQLLDKGVTEHFPKLTGMFQAFMDASIAFRKKSYEYVRQDRLLMVLDDLWDETVEAMCKEKDRSLRELRSAVSQVLLRLQEVEHLVGIIEVHQELEHRPVKILSAEDVETAISVHPSYAVVFYLAATSDMKKCLENAVKMLDPGIPSEIFDELCQIPTYSGSSKSMLQCLQRFVELSVASNALFILTESEKDSEGLTVVYKKAVRLDDQIALPMAPEVPSVVGVSHDQFTLLLEPTVASVEFIEITVTGRNEVKNERVKAGVDKVVFYRLLQACVYHVNVTAHTPLGPVPCDTEIVVTTGLPQQVGKPEAIQTTAMECVLMWRSECTIEDQSLTWEVEVTTDETKSEPILLQLDQVKRAVEHFTAEVELQPHLTYRFRVRASIAVVEWENSPIQYSKTQFSEQSEPLEMSGSARQIAKSQVLRHSELVESGHPSIHQLVMREEHVDKARKLRKVTYGSPECYKPMKTILVVGATGAGKSTLINALANYILGVNFDDGYRFRIIEENRDSNQAKSQTKWVTAYVFYYQANFPAEFPCSLTIVDTPGFGDTDGIAADERITQQLKEYFHGKGDAGIDALDAIGFVVQASCARLTPTQQYIFDSILALFGRDVKDNIFALATFADGQKAPVMQALDEARMPYTQGFKFNNSALFADRTSSGDGDENEQDFDRSFWAMGVQSYKKFLTHVARAQPKSLVLTNQVMDERQHLQARVSGLQTQIKVATTKIESLRSGLDCFQQHQTDIERNRDFEFEVKQSKIVHIVLAKGTYVTNCLTCNRTCHYPCMINDDGQKWGCAAMKSPRDQNTTCTVCEKACHWTMHRNMPERLEVQTEVIRQTVSEMKKEYEQAFEQQLSTEDVIVKIIEDIEYSETEIACLVNDVRNSLQRLNEIALRPDHMTTVGYIDILIRSEKQQALDGWQSRVHQLENVRERAKLINSYSRFHNISEPYRDLKTEIMQRKRGRKEGRQEGTGVVQALKGFRDKTVAGVKNLVGWRN